MKQLTVDGRRQPADGIVKKAVKRLPVTVRLFLFMLIIFSPLAQAETPVPPESKPYTLSYVGEMKTHIAVYEDTFVQLARRYDVGFVELRAANPHLDPWIPGEGVAILIPSRHILPQAPRDGIVINLPEQRLYAFITPGQPPVTHPIGVGRTGLSTPTGRTKVARKKIGPVWRPTARMREEDPDLPEKIGPGLDNPMGTHALYLDWPQYAIHGTNKPYGIGRRVSSGCIRLYPEDIVTLFEQVPEGMPVTVVDQPVKAGWIGDELYLEAHPSLAQSYDTEQDGVVHSYEFTARDVGILMRAAGDYADRIDWRTVREVVRQRRGVPVVVAVKPGLAGHKEKGSMMGPFPEDKEDGKEHT